MHMGRAHTFIIYCGNVLNAWLNTGIQIHPGEDKGGKWVRLTRRKSHIKTQNGHLLRVFPLINVHLYYFTNTHIHTLGVPVRILSQWTRWSGRSINAPLSIMEEAL